MNTKQIEEKKDELVRMIRLYVIGLVPAYQVKNTLNCLFVDVLLEKETQEHLKKLDLGWNRETFDKLFEEMVSC